MRDSVPHALEFCPKRIKSYVHKGGFCESLALGKPVCNPFVTENLVALESCVASEEDVEHLSLAGASAVEAIPVSSSDVSAEIASDSPVKINAHCHAAKTSVIPGEEQFFRSEALGTSVSPECGGCKCGKCPIPGSRYNLQQQQDLQVVDSNLRYSACERRYYTVYPWRFS